MRNFNETGVMFTDEQRKQIVNTILGFRNCFPYSIETIKKEFVVGNVKFRFIITNNGEFVSVSVECAVKGSNGRYGNMLCYAYDEFKPFNPKPDVWKFRLIEVVLKDILGIVNSNDVAPVAEAIENQNQVEDNATISNTPNLDELSDKIENYLREYIEDNTQVMLGDFENYKIFKPIGEWRRVFKEHLGELGTDKINEIFGDVDLNMIYNTLDGWVNYEGIIFEFFDNNMPSHFNNTESCVFYDEPDIIDAWSDYVYDWAYGMLGDKGSQFNELEEVFQDYDVPTLFSEFMLNEFDFDEEGLAYCIYDDMSEHLVNPIEVFNELVEEAEKENNN